MRGGFSYDAGAGKPGTLDRQPFVWNASRLTVIAKIGGELPAACWTRSALPVPGFFSRDCRPLTGAALTQEVRWTGNRSSPRGRFRLRNAELYAFTLIEQAGGTRRVGDIGRQRLPRC